VVRFIVKIGGGEGSLKPAIQELADLWHSGTRWVLIHGGSAQMNDIATRLGYPPQLIVSPSGYSSRRTDYDTMKILAMVLAGSVNIQIVSELQACGVNAFGLTGLNGRLLEGPRKKAIKSVQEGRLFVLRDDYSGVVERVNVDLLRILISKGYAPVVCPPAISYENEIINVDSDRAAAAVAVALGVETLVLLTGSPGLLRDPDDPTTVISQLERTAISDAIESYARGRMKSKLLAASEAIRGGVRRVIIFSSASASPIQSALAGAGTVIQ
jgi:[amino group carrier protein]-L-2-aminoadipate 6-kinase